VRAGPSRRRSLERIAADAGQRVDGVSLVAAAFIAVLEIVWWIFDRMYST
jgi:hypothetical protein